MPPDIFAQVLRGGEPYVSDGRKNFIDKAWDDFHSVFRTKSPPLNLVITGDCFHPQSPHTLEDFCAGCHEWYVGYASPQLVCEAARALMAISATQLKEWYDDSGCSGYDSEFYLFEVLKSAYVTAAEHGNALEILVC